MMDGEAFAVAVSERASSALSRIPARTAEFAIGSLSFTLTAPAGDDETWMGRAFLKPGKASAAPAHALFTWGGVAADERPPPRPWDMAAAQPLGLVGSHTNDVVRCAYDFHTDSLVVSDLAKGRSYTWFPDIGALAPWAKASPFRIPLSWLCNLHGMQIVHSAAVAIDGRAALLVGNGGSGKSTTALACALAGFEYLGDDYCAVEPAAGKVHLVYRTAKLFQHTLDLLPSLEDRVDNLDRITMEKGVMFLRPDDVKLRPSAELTAILLPRVSEDGGPPRLVPASRNETIKAVLPSTIGGLMGGTSVTPRLIMELVRTVPAYHLLLAPDMNAVTDTVATRLKAA
jgi:hypothetical protein